MCTKSSSQSFGLRRLHITGSDMAHERNTILELKTPWSENWVWFARITGYTELMTHSLHAQCQTFKWNIVSIQNANPIMCGDNVSGAVKLWTAINSSVTASRGWDGACSWKVVLICSSFSRAFYRIIIINLNLQSLRTRLHVSNFPEICPWLQEQRLTKNGRSGVGMSTFFSSASDVSDWKHRDSQALKMANTP